jgi:hypothetical protein
MEKKSITFIYCGNRSGCYEMYQLLNITPQYYNNQSMNNGPPHLNQKFIAVRKITPEMRQILSDNDLLHRLLYYERMPRNDEYDVVHEFENVDDDFMHDLYYVTKTFKGSEIVRQYFEEVPGHKYSDYLERYEENMYLILLTEYLLFTSGYTALISRITNSSFLGLLLTESIQDIAIDHLDIVNLLHCLPEI